MDERKRALVVGINAYGGGIPSLGSAVRDAEEIARQLELAHGYEVELLRDAEATVSSIIRSLTEVSEAGLSEESSFVLYYAGHGIAADDSDGTGPQGYLLAHDAELTNQDSWLGMNSLRDALEGLACRHLMMVLDCCYAGAFRTSGGGLQRCSGGILIDADRFDEAVSDLDLGVATISADGNRLAVFDPESRQVTIFTDDAAANVVIDLSTDAAGLDDGGEEEFNKLELTLSPNGSLLGVSSFAGADYTFWNVDSTSLLLTQPRRTIRGFAFSPNASLVVFDRRDGGIEIRSASDFSIVAVLNGDGETDTRVLHFLSDGSVLLEATVGGGLTLWDFEPGSWMRRACKVSGRTLTQDERLRLIPEQVEIDPCRSTEVSDG